MTKMKTNTIFALICLSLLTPALFAQTSVTNLQEQLNQQSLSEEMSAAIQALDKAKVEALLAKGADVNAKDSKGWMPLNLAAGFTNVDGRSDIAELLIARGADVNAKNFGETPLYRATNTTVNTSKLVELLISKGADLNARDVYGRTPLLATDNGRVADLLIAKGADINAKDNDGNTLLLTAAGENTEIVELLVAKGADVNAKNSKGETALQKLTIYLQHQQQTSPNSAVFLNDLRKIIIEVATAMKPLPPVPEESRRHFVMGTTLFNYAKTPDDYSQVTGEFKQASDLAPWWPEARYNLALAKEAAGDYSGAVADLKLYQTFKLSDDEARSTQDKIYVLEAKQQKRVASDTARQAEENSPAVQLEKFIKGLDGGVWRCDRSLWSSPNWHGNNYVDSEAGHTYVVISGHTITSSSKILMDRGRVVQNVDYDPNFPIIWKTTITGHKLFAPEPAGSLRLISYSDEVTISDDGRSITENRNLVRSGQVETAVLHYVRIK